MVAMSSMVAWCHHWWHQWCNGAINDGGINGGSNEGSNDGSNGDTCDGDGGIVAWRMHIVQVFRELVPQFCELRHTSSQVSSTKIIQCDKNKSFPQNAVEKRYGRIQILKFWSGKKPL